MKIAQISTGLSPVIPAQDLAAGREQYIYWLAEHLSRLGHEIHVIDIKEKESQREKRRHSASIFHEIWCPPLSYEYNLPFLRSLFGHILFTTRESIFGLLVFFPLGKLIANEKIDVIHTHQRETTLSAVVMNRLRGKKTVVLYTPHLVTRINTWIRKLIHLDEILALRWADHIIALNPSHKDLLVSEYKIDHNKITSIIGGGAATDEIKEFLTQKPGTYHQSNIILCVGIITERKNQLTAAKVISKVVAVYPEVKLVFAGHIGDTNYLNSIKDFIAQNGLSSNIEFKGLVSKQELYTLYSEARLFLFPTTAETQSAVIREALSFRLPIIASDIGAHSDIINQREGSAILIDPYDINGFASAIIRLFHDDVLRQKMSRAAGALAETLSYNSVAHETINLYNRLVQAKKVGRGEQR